MTKIRELERQGFDELRFEHCGWPCFLWFDDKNDGWVVEQCRKRVGFIPYGDFPEIIYCNPEDWLKYEAGRIIDSRSCR